MKRTFNKNKNRRHLRIPKKDVGSEKNEKLTIAPINMNITQSMSIETCEGLADQPNTFIIPNNSKPMLITTNTVEQFNIYQEANHVDIDTIFHTWQYWVMGIRQELSSVELENREELTESPLIEFWNSDMSAWLDDVTEATKKLTELLAKSDIDFSSEIFRLEEIDYTVSYDEIMRHLIEAISAIQNFINTTSRKYSEKDENYKELIYIRNRIKDFLVWMHQEPYKKCFLVMGSLGSGKTAFIYKLLSEASESELFLYVRFSAHQTIMETILQQINEIVGAKFTALTHFIEYLYTKYMNFKVIIILDNFHKWVCKDYLYKEELQKIIAHYSQYKALYWIVTIHDTAYGDINTPDGFWRRYSSLTFEQLLENRCILEGWINLDHLNQDQETGIQMLNAFYERTGEIKPLFLQSWDLEKEHSNIRELTAPFIAWIYIDSRHEIPNAVDLRYIKFIEHLWLRRKSILADMYRIEKKLNINIEECKAVVEKYLRQITKDLKQSKEYELVYEIGDYSKEQQVLLDLFTKVNLLKSEIQTSTNYLEGNKKVFTCALEIFWQYYLADATYSLDLEKNNTKESIISKINMLQATDYERGIFEFLLLILDRKLPSKLLFDVFSYICGRIEIYSPQLWFQAAKMDRAQHLLIQNALENSSLGISANSIYAYMYFISEFISAESVLPLRLQLLNPYFEYIKNANLAPYYKYIVDRLLEKVDTGDRLRECMYNLSGLEILVPKEILTAETDFLGRNIVNSIAAAAVAVMIRLTPKDSSKTLKLLLEYLDKRPKVHFPKPIFSDNRYFFEEWVISHFCTWFVSMHEVQSYYILAANDWFSKKRGIISFWMKKELHLALGHWYQAYTNYYYRDENIKLREKPKRGKDPYYDLVYSLTYSGSRDKQESAFFLIRHTVPTYRKREVQVPEKFHDFLRYLKRKNIFAEKHKSFYDANLN